MHPQSHAIGLAAALAMGASVSAAPSISSALATEPITQPTVGADVAVVDVTGIQSMDGLGSPNNVLIFLWIGPFNSITGIGWDVVLQTLVPNSRRRDISMWVRDTSNTQFSGFGIQPGVADPTPGGPTPYSSDGITKLVEYNIAPVRALADGLIRLEFTETPDNAPGEADGLWVSGTVSLQTSRIIPPVPPPATGMLFSFAGVATLRRTRRTQPV